MFLMSGICEKNRFVGLTVIVVEFCYGESGKSARHE